MKRSSLHAAACTGDDTGSDIGRAADASGIAPVPRSSIQEAVGDDDVGDCVGEALEDVSWSDIVGEYWVVLSGEEPDSVLELTVAVAVYGKWRYTGPPESE